MTTFTAHGSWNLRDWNLGALKTANLQSHSADAFAMLAGDGTVATFGGTAFGHFGGGLPGHGVVDQIDVAGVSDSFTITDFALTAAQLHDIVKHASYGKLEQALFAGDDTFNFADGDHNSAAGFAGDDHFNFGATFDAGDKVDGGDGNDTLSLDGDYSAGVTFADGTMRHVENLTVAHGHTYNLTFTNQNVGKTDTFNVNATALGANDRLFLNAAGERGGAIDVNGGAGNDRIETGSGDDVLGGGDGRDILNAGKGVDIVYGGAGVDRIRASAGDDTIYGDEGNDILSPGGGHDTVYAGTGDDDIFLRGRTGMADTIDGGDGTDTIHLRGADISDVTLNAPSLANIENVELGPKNSYGIRLPNDLTNPMTIDGSNLGPDDVLNLDGSQVVGDALTVIGGAANDVIAGGGAGDILQGGGGGDTMSGGTGPDTFRYSNASESSGSNVDTITDFDGATDTIDVANAVVAVDGIVHGLLGSLDGLTSLLGVANLAAGHAVLVQPLLGALAGSTLMVIDQNGVLGYQPGADMVINLANPVDLGGFGIDNII